MKYINFSVVLLVLLALGSCKDDDDAPIATVPPRDRGEQQITDDIALQDYLDTHYYNASLFETPGNYEVSDIVISELPMDANGNYLALPDPDNNAILSDVVEAKTTTYAENDYNYYVLNLNQGGGETPNFTDDIRINYSGNLENGTVFDNTSNPATLDLLSLIQGWREVFPLFGTSETDAVINPDGTVTYDNYGLGVMFLPSGLGYYNTAQGSIPAYSNLIFRFALYEATENDHDGDGIASQLEDLNNNGDVLDDDTDEDGTPNFADTDDDGDGVATIFEDLDNDGDPTNDDSDGDGIANYLDEDSTESNQI